MGYKVVPHFVTSVCNKVGCRKKIIFRIFQINIELQTAYEQVKEAKEAACDLFGNVTRWLIEETPRMGLELCVSRKVRD